MRSDYLTCADHVELATESDTHGDVALGAYLRSPPELPLPSCRPRACPPVLLPCEPIARLVAKEIGDKLLCIEDTNENFFNE